MALSDFSVFCKLHDHHPKVYLALKKDNPEVLYALKVIRKDLVLKDGTLEKIIKEKEILKNAKYPFIVEMIQGF